MQLDRALSSYSADHGVLITVNLDAEYAARAFVPDLAVGEGTPFKIMGRDGMETGLARLLEVLHRFQVKATFFVPGKVVETYPEAMQMIVAQGHEIGCRGYENENLALYSPSEQREIIFRGRQAVERVCQVTPQGFRAPAGELTAETLHIVKELKFTYSSSLYNDDIPYVHCWKDGGRLLEIPIHTALYDLPYFIFHFDPPIPAGQSRIACSEDVLTNWKWEYIGCRRYGACYVLQLDPQIIGTQGRIYMLEELLEFIRSQGDAWITTGAELVNVLSNREFFSCTR